MGEGFFYMLFPLQIIYLMRCLFGMLLFGRKLPKKKNYWISLIVWIVFCFGVTMTIPIFTNGVTVYYMFICFLEFILSMYTLRLCYVVEWSIVFYIASAVLSAEHISSMVDSLIALLKPELLSFRTAQTITLPALINSVLINLVCYIVIYWLMFREKQIISEHGLNRSTMFMLLLASMGINMFINVVYTNLIEKSSMWISAEKDSPQLSIFEYALNLLLSISLLFVQDGMMRKSQTEKKLQTVSNLWEQAREQYRVSKENIEAINIKCHDLKHQLLAVKDKTDEKEYASLMETIDSYGSGIETNNEVLDVIFQEKNFQCRKQGIQFTCIIDGAALNFMETTDLYVLFGNLIDNCIEAVSKLPEEARYIQIMVRREKGFLIITTENCFQGELKWIHGRLVTSKPNQEYHGFGILSIEKIIKKYDGRYSISTDDHIFIMNIVFPEKK